MSPTTADCISPAAWYLNVHIVGGPTTMGCCESGPMPHAPGPAGYGRPHHSGMPQQHVVQGRPINNGPMQANNYWAQPAQPGMPGMPGPMYQQGPYGPAYQQGPYCQPGFGGPGYGPPYGGPAYGGYGPGYGPGPYQNGGGQGISPAAAGLAGLAGGFLAAELMDDIF